MLFDTGKHGIGMVEVDRIYTKPDGTRVGKKDERTANEITYLVFPSGNCGIVKTKLIPTTPEEKAAIHERLREICARATYAVTSAEHEPEAKGEREPSPMQGTPKSASKAKRDWMRPTAPGEAGA